MITRRVKAKASFNFTTQLVDKMFVRDEVAIVAFKNEAEFQAFIDIECFDEVGNHIPIGVPLYPVLPPPEDAVISTAEEFREDPEEVNFKVIDDGSSMIAEPEEVVELEPGWNTLSLSGNLAEPESEPEEVEESEPEEVEESEPEEVEEVVEPEEVEEVVEPDDIELSDFVDKVQKVVSDGVLDSQEVDDLLVDAAEAIMEKADDQKDAHTDVDEEPKKRTSERYKGFGAGSGTRKSE